MPADIPEECTVAELEERLLDEAYRLERLCFERPYPRWYFEMLYALSRGLAYAALCRGRLVGFVMAVWSPRHRLAHVVDLAVHPAWRRRGIGSALMEAVERAAAGRGAALVALETWVSNLEARRFYERLGYRPLRVIPEYYEWGEAAILYVKLLARRRV